MDFSYQLVCSLRLFALYLASDVVLPLLCVCAHQPMPLSEQAPVAYSLFHSDAHMRNHTCTKTPATSASTHAPRHAQADMQVVDLVRFMSKMLEVTVCGEELCACRFLRQRPKPQLEKKNPSVLNSPFVQKIAGGGGGGGVRRRSGGGRRKKERLWRSSGGVAAHRQVKRAQSHIGK